MSQATRAKSAEERAEIAAAYIRRGRPATRAFADCFEMGDGSMVLSILWDRAAARPDSILARNISRYLTKPEDAIPEYIRASEAALKGFRNNCPVCGAPQLGVHHHGD